MISGKTSSPWDIIMVQEGISKFGLHWPFWDWLAGLVTCLLLWCGGHGENHRGRLGAELTGVGLKMAMGTRDPIPDGYLLY